MREKIKTAVDVFMVLGVFLSMSLHSFGAGVHKIAGYSEYEKNKKNSTYLLARLGWFCPVASEPVKPYFTRFLRVLTFCLGASKIVILKENGVVNGVVK